MPNSKIGGHYSQAYDEELQLAVARFLQMAKLAQQQLRDAMTAFSSADLDLAKQVKQSDRQVNNFEVDIDEHCLDILARRQPAATDLRLVLSILKSVNDVERIGDMAKRIAKAMIRELPNSWPSQAQIHTLNLMGDDVLQMFERAVMAFEQMDAKAALEVLRDEKAIDSTYDNILQSSLASMMQDVQQIAVSLQVSQVAKSLERVGGHSRNICEQAIFLSKGSHAAH